MKRGSEPVAQWLARHLSTPKRMLLVDDDLVWVRFFRDKIEPFNLNLDVCTTCASARGALESEKYDAVVLDQVLTNGRGVDLYREISVKSPSMQVVFLTGHPLELIVEKVSMIGPARVFSKDKMLIDGFLEQLMAQLNVTKQS